MIFSKETTLTITLLDHQFHFLTKKIVYLISFRFREFTAYYSLIYKPNETNEVEEHQPNLLHDCLMKGNYGNSNYLRIIKMMNSNEKMQCPKVYRALRYNNTNKYRFRKKYFHHLLFLFFFISIRKKLLEEICRHVREN